jgi:mono/diheme cytochrome c family protein
MPGFFKRALAVVAALLVVTTAAVYGASERRFAHRFDVPAHPLVVRSDSATIARGAHVARIRMCQECHGPGFSGHVEFDNFMIGRLAAPNLTMGGRGAELADADWERAVRHGVRRDGSPLLIMPAFEHTGMSDEDLAALVAYVRSLAPSRNVPPAPRSGPVLRAMFVGGAAPLLSAEQIDHTKPHPSTVAVAPTAEYGEYLAGMCKGCHGPQLSGGKIPGAPPEWKPAANITPGGIGRYTQTDFIVALRTGRRPDGSAIDPQMPWKQLSQMTDVELKAIYAYLRSQPSREYGNR